MLDDGYSKCSMYAVNFTELFATAEANGTAELLADPSWPMQPCVYGWEYDREEIPYSTIATEVSFAAAHYSRNKISHISFNNKQKKKMCIAEAFFTDTFFLSLCFMFVTRSLIGCAIMRRCRQLRRQFSSLAPLWVVCCSVGLPTVLAVFHRWWAAICWEPFLALPPHSQTPFGRSLSADSCWALPSIIASWWCTF